MSTAARILLVEDDPTFRSLLSAILEDEGYLLLEREDGKAALMALQRQSFDLVLSDLRLPGMNGLDLFRTATANGIAPPFILLTAFGTVEEAVSAMKEGVADFLTKPLKDPATLRSLVKRILDSGNRARSIPVPKERAASGLPPDEVLFAGKAMLEIKRLLNDVSPTDATVLITGESGTGKELAAKYIHLGSKRAEAPFVAINCAAIPENLLESELFGHEKGAFTGATQARQGKFELAAGGTLFLDEIGELPLMLQSKLLRVLQERIFERVGGSRELKADLRIIAATNCNLDDEVKTRHFREDLYYRLNVFPVELPPLKKRRDGIPELINYLLNRASAQTGEPAPDISADLIETLADYDWPGNIRELQNVLERAVILGRGSITLNNIPEQVRCGKGMECLSSDHSLKEKEKNAILEALAISGNNRRVAAGRLGISRRTLQYRLKEYGIVDS